MSNELAAALRANGQPEEALQQFERVYEIFKKSFGPNHPKVAAALDGWARTLRALRRFEEAREKNDEARVHLQESLRITEAILGPEHLNVMVMLTALGDLALDQNKHEDAGAYCQRVVAAVEKRLGPSHTYLSYGLECVARGQLGIKRPKQAVETLVERALSITTNPHNHNRIQYFLAGAMWEAKGDRKRAQRLAEEARRGCEEENSPSLAEAEYWLRKHGANN